jgi:ABC-type multidrug transport system fused ATPase/permease subunit
MTALKRLLRHLRPYWRGLAITSVLILVKTLVALLPPLFTRAVIDDVIDGGQTQLLLPLMVGLLGVYGVIALTDFGDQFLRHTIGEKILYDLRVRLYDHLQRLSLSFFERTSTGELMSRVSNDVNALEQFMTHGTILAGVAVVRLVGATVVLMLLDWRLALIALIPVPIIAAGLRWFNKRTRPIYRRVRDRLGDVNTRLQDDLAGIRVIQAFGQEGAELERFKSVSASYMGERIASIKMWSTVFPGLGFFVDSGGVLVLGFGAWMVVDGTMTLGTLVAFLAYIVSFYEPIRRLTDIDNIIQQAAAAADRIFELLDVTPEIQDAADAIALEQVAGEIRFEDAHFRYGEGEEVLSDVEFTVRPGEMVALVGPSGAGKTSIANLVCRFYDPTAGRVLVDGRDLRGVKIESLRRHVAVVLQDTFLFNASVRRNLLYGKPDASDEELFAAARAAYAHEFIEALPNGYDTEIGERGVKLSGGQRQRLALARAILADPRILILDEATSSVDAEAEYLIQQALEEVLKGRTALVIAHRLSTIRSADKIIALENGRIREVGRHGELLAKNGLYSQLYQRQVELAAKE